MGIRKSRDWGVRRLGLELRGIRVRGAGEWRGTGEEWLEVRRGRGKVVGVRKRRVRGPKVKEG